jgi:thiol:disulfide interchange protein DsbA
MRLFQTLLCALALAGFTTLAAASASAPANGTEYLTLPVPQPSEPGKKIEVIEFFEYGCPHCYAFDPVLAGWLRKQGDNVVFKRVHVPRDPNVEPRQRLFFTLEALGQVEQYHSKVFNAIHVERLHMTRDEHVFEWAEKAGLDRARFISTYRSFPVQAKVLRANTMMELYKVNMWPMIIIDGRYQTSPTQASAGTPAAAQSESAQHQLALQVMDFLVAKAKAEKK